MSAIRTSDPIENPFPVNTQAWAVVEAIRIMRPDLYNVARQRLNERAAEIFTEATDQLIESDTIGRLMYKVNDTLSQLKPEGWMLIPAQDLDGTRHPGLVHLYPMSEIEAVGFDRSTRYRRKTRSGVKVVVAPERPGGSGV